MEPVEPGLPRRLRGCAGCFGHDIATAGATFTAGKLGATPCCLLRTAPDLRLCSARPPCSTPPTSRSSTSKQGLGGLKWCPARPANGRPRGNTEAAQDIRKRRARHHAPRICFLLQVRPELLTEYRARHAEVWPDMLQALHDSGWHRYSLFPSRRHYHRLRRVRRSSDSAREDGGDRGQRALAGGDEQFFAGLERQRPDEGIRRSPRSSTCD